MTSFEIYQAIGDIGISYLEFAMSMEGWEVHPMVRGGEMVAVIKFRGPEFHFHSFGRHSFTRQDMRSEVFDPLFEKYGFARTKTPIADTRQQRFNERLGFHRIGEQDNEIHYQIDRI